MPHAGFSLEAKRGGLKTPPRRQATTISSFCLDLGLRQKPQSGSCLSDESRLLDYAGPERSSTELRVVTPQRLGRAEDGAVDVSTGRAGIAIEHAAQDRSARRLAKYGSPASWGSVSRTVLHAGWQKRTPPPYYCDGGLPPVDPPWPPPARANEASRAGRQRTDEATIAKELLRGKNYGAPPRRRPEGRLR